MIVMSTNHSNFVRCLREKNIINKLIKSFICVSLITNTLDHHFAKNICINFPWHLIGFKITIQMNDSFWPKRYVLVPEETKKVTGCCCFTLKSWQHQWELVSSFVFYTWKKKLFLNKCTYPSNIRRWKTPGKINPNSVQQLDPKNAISVEKFGIQSTTMPDNSTTQARRTLCKDNNMQSMYKACRIEENIRL